MSELKALDVGLGQYCEDGSPCVVAFDADRNPRLLNGQIYLKDDVDAVLAEKDAEIRRLKRALWLARAERATAKQAYYDVLSRGISSEIGEMYDVWNNVERKCRAKAEEYK